MINVCANMANERQYKMYKYEKSHMKRLAIKKRPSRTLKVIAVR